jgi:cyclic pyranopterin phosphate synthase
MVDVGPKALTQREAVAEGYVKVSSELAEAIRGNSLKKGDLLAVARLAGIQAAKRTSELIPLCHNLPLDDVNIEAWLDGDVVRLRGHAKATWRTGVEMEALTAVAIAALTVVDMGKAIDPAMVIGGIRLLRKTGGTRGDYVAPQHDEVE